jgi:hypothetical protein
MNTVNWLAVVVAGISAFVLGGVWYSPALLGNVWMKENNFTEEDIKRGNKGKIFGWTGVLLLISSVNLAMFLGNTPGLNLMMGAMYGFLTGLWIFCGIAIVALFEMKSTSYIFINGGYCFFALGLMGAILGVWR